MIAFDRVSKSFGRFVALDGLSLHIERGERVALVGPNGSGKTTLLRALLGLVRVRGRVTVAGVDVGERPDIALAHVAYVPQMPPPIDAPIADLVRAHATLRRIPEYETTEMAARLGLELDVLAPMRFRDLPSTTKNRLLAAMALASGADVLACDEPRAGFDEPARAALFEVLEERSGEDIVVLCSRRRQDVLKLVDRIVEIRDGRVARDEHVVRRSGPRQTILAQVMT